MAKIKVKNVGNSLVVVPNERGGDILIPPQNEAEIEEKYLTHFSGKLIKVEEEKNEENSAENTKEETSEQEETQPIQESAEETQVQEPTEEGVEPVEEKQAEEQPAEEKPKRGRRR